jgi:ubiquinone/menaquinone biosynthesis C-methylase UbiE
VQVRVGPYFKLEKMKKTNPKLTFESFIARISNEVYSEEESQMHNSIIEKMVPEFLNKFKFEKNVKILDVGCGQGYACEKFKEQGYDKLVAISLSENDVQGTHKKGFESHKMDMSFMEFEDNSFDVIWARHVIEHSPFPYLTLLEFNRILKKEGLIYLEMPEPDSPRVLERWPNHYSILGKKMWLCLFLKSGFEIKTATSMSVNLEFNEINKRMTEKYYVFIIKKVKDELIS